MDSIPARCRDENGYLVRQSLMTDVPYGRRTVAKAGCGFLTVYNAARFFGLPVRESEVWQYFHRGVFLGAVMGTTIGHLCRGVYRFSMRITGVPLPPLCAGAAVRGRAVRLPQFLRAGAAGVSGVLRQICEASAAAAAAHRPAHHVHPAAGQAE